MKQLLIVLCVLGMSAGLSSCFPVPVGCHSVRVHRVYVPRPVVVRPVVPRIPHRPHHYGGRVTYGYRGR